jgi:hypothetical protein
MGLLASCGCLQLANAIIIKYCDIELSGL